MTKLLRRAFTCTPSSSAPAATTCLQILQHSRWQAMLEIATTCIFNDLPATIKLMSTDFGNNCIATQCCQLHPALLQTLQSPSLTLCQSTCTSSQGLYDPKSKIPFRAVAVKERRLDDALIESRLQRALSLRQRLFHNTDTTGRFRIFTRLEWPIGS